MPSAAGIIIATGTMRVANHALDSNQPLTTVVDKIDWKVIPATAIAAVMFYALSQASEQVATALAAIVLFTAFITPDHSVGGNLATSPLGTLMKLSGILPQNAG